MRIRDASTIALVALLGLSGALDGQGPSARASVSGHGIPLTADMPVTVTIEWELDYGPSRFLTIESPNGRYETAAGQRLGTRFGGPLIRSNVSGPIVIREPLSIPPEIIVKAYELASPTLDLARRFDARSAQGEVVPSREGRVSLTILRPKLSVDGEVVPERVPFCRPVTVTVTWDLGLADTGALDVSSPAGTFRSAASGENLGTVPVPIDVPALRSDRRVPEVLTVPIEVTGSGGRIVYERDFTFTPRGPSDIRPKRSARVILVVEPRALQVSATPSRVNLPLGQPLTVSLGWTGGTPCDALSSASGRFQTPAGRVLGRVDERLVLSGVTPVPEVLTVPAAVSLEAQRLGAASIEYVRDFTSGAANAPSVAGRVTLDLTGALAGPFAVQRLELRFRDGELFRIVPPGEAPSAVAEVTYLGTGLLRGVWEVADPGTTSGVPVFRPLLLVNQPLAGGGRAFLTSPPLPAAVSGLHRVRLRITDPAVGFTPPELTYEVGGEGGWSPPDVAFESALLPRPPADAPPVDDDDPIEEREVVVLSADMDEARAAERAFGLRAVRRTRLASFELVMSVLRVPPETTTARVVAALRASFPTLWVDANRLYSPQGDGLPANADEVAAGLGWDEARRRCFTGRVGLVDTGVEHPAVNRRSFLVSGETAAPPEHGTAVAGLLLGWPADPDPFPGLVPQAEVYAAEVVYRVGPGRRTFGRLYRDFVNSYKLAQALDWLVAVEVDLVNVGVAGRRGLVLEYVLEHRLADLGVLVVAPYGRDPERDAYPAAFGSVFGTVAGDRAPGSFDALGVPPIRLAAEPAECGNSCASPFVTAALGVAIAGEERPSRGDLDGILSATRRGRLRPLRAPDCPP